MEETLITIAISIAGPALLGVFGLIWKISAKVSLHEKMIEAHDRRIRDNMSKLQKLDDKQYSIVRNFPKELK
jgi:hypothetical protein|tara:strand:- start:295 stop:510 length:216 start_codon:yes stop_codon:yes gene_type:complete